MMAKQPGSFVGFLIVVLLISRFLGYYFARRISRPIEEISALASAVARGDLTRNSATDSPDEVGSLARSFNTMIDGLRDWQRIKRVEFEMEKGRERHELKIAEGTIVWKCLSYPLDEEGHEVGWDRCQPIGSRAWETGESGIACRSAATHDRAGEELALFAVQEI